MHGMDTAPWSWTKNLATSPLSSCQYRRAPQGQSGFGDTYTKRADEITKEVERQCKVVDDAIIAALLYGDNIEGNF